MKRKGFMSLEMLLIIGVLVAALAGIFALYKKIQASNASMQVTQDITTIFNGLDRYKGATGAYPIGVAGVALNAQLWNEGGAYISNDVGNRWLYTAAPTTVIDPTTNTTVGYVTIQKTANAFAALKDNEIKDILVGKCINGTTNVLTDDGINPSAIIGMTSAAGAVAPCVISNNVVLLSVP